MLKAVIVILFIAVVVSLSSGLVFLFKDAETDRKRTLYALGTRIALAATLLAVVSWGLYTGELQLGTNAPWHQP